MKILFKLFIAALIIVAGLTSPVLAAQEQNPLVRVKGVVWYVSSLDLYGIITEEGKKYHPTRKLPKDFLKEGLEVVVEGKIREDLVGARMWGKAFEVVIITQASKYIGPEDKEAIRLLLQRMDAFNKKDLGILQEIDVVARGLTSEEFNSWIFDNGNFTLHYVETIPETNNQIGSTTIRGYCLYSRQHLSSMTLFDKTNYSVMKFTMSKLGGSWKFTDTTSDKPDGVDFDQYVEQLLAMAKQKYGTTDLAAWKAK